MCQRFFFCKQFFFSLISKNYQYRCLLWFLRLVDNRLKLCNNREIRRKNKIFDAQKVFFICYVSLQLYCDKISTNLFSNVVLLITDVVYFIVYL